MSRDGSGDNVVSARGGLGDGAVREFSGSDLDLVSEAEGTTGLISEVTVKVMPKEGLGVISIGCPDAYDLQRLVERIVKDRLPIWSLSFINPRMAEMKNRAPLRMHAGQAVGERVLLTASLRHNSRLPGEGPPAYRRCPPGALQDLSSGAPLGQDRSARVGQPFRDHGCQTAWPEPRARRGGHPAFFSREYDGRSGTQGQPACRQGGAGHSGRRRGQTRSGHPRLHPQRPAGVLVQLHLSPVADHHEDRGEKRRKALFHGTLLRR